MYRTISISESCLFSHLDTHFSFEGSTNNKSKRAREKIFIQIFQQNKNLVFIAFGACNTIAYWFFFVCIYLGSCHGWWIHCIYSLSFFFLFFCKAKHFYNTLNRKHSCNKIKIWYFDHRQISKQHEKLLHTNFAIDFVWYFSLCWILLV